MIERSLSYVINRAIEAEKTVIVGAGGRGQELLTHLMGNDSIKIEAFFDNNENITGKMIQNVKITRPYKAEGMCIYIIAVDQEKSRKEFYLQYVLSLFCVVSF